MQNCHLKLISAIECYVQAKTKWYWGLQQLCKSCRTCLCFIACPILLVIAPYLHNCLMHLRTGIPWRRRQNSRCLYHSGRCSDAATNVWPRYSVPRICGTAYCIVSYHLYLIITLFFRCSNQIDFTNDSPSFSRVFLQFFLIFGVALCAIFFNIFIDTISSNFDTL